MPQYKAAAYLRYSRHTDKSAESDSIANQLKLIEDFVRQHGDIELVSKQVDDGITGVIFDRPAFKSMMQDIENGNVNCVIVKDLSRLGREHIETARYLQRIFPAYGVRFIAINDNVDTINEEVSEDLSVSVRNIVNEAYCRDISIKTRTALSAKRQNGEYVGACTVYGYTKLPENKNRLAVDEYAAGIVRDIFAKKLEGMSASRIAEALNQAGVLSPIAYKKYKGIPHPTGGFADKENAKWSATTIIRILNDETYTGTLLQGKQSTHSYKLKEPIPLPTAEWARTENAHPELVSKTDFDLAQQIMRLDTRTAPGGDSVYPFSGLLICGNCGARMTRKTVPYKDEKYYYYYCPTGKMKGCKHANMVKEAELAVCVWDIVKAHIDNVMSLDSMLAKIDADSINQQIIRQFQVQIAQTEERLLRIKGYRATLYENYINSILKREEYQCFKQEYDKDCETLENSLLRLRQELDDAKHCKNRHLEWMRHFNEFAGQSELDRRALIQLVQCVTITDKRTIDIQFKYALDMEQTKELLIERAGDLIGA